MAGIPASHQCSLKGAAALGGPALAEALAEAIRSELVAQAASGKSCRVSTEKKEPLASRT